MIHWILLSTCQSCYCFGLNVEIYYLLNFDVASYNMYCQWLWNCCISCVSGCTLKSYCLYYLRNYLLLIFLKLRLKPVHGIRMWLFLINVKDYQASQLPLHTGPFLLRHHHKSQQNQFLPLPTSNSPFQSKNQTEPIPNSYIISLHTFEIWRKKTDPTKHTCVLSHRTLEQHAPLRGRITTCR